MKRVYIRSIGIHSERCADMGQLANSLRGGDVAASAAERYSAPAVRLGAAGLAVIDREDRSTLNEVSTGVLNALSDMLASQPQAALGDCQDTLVFTGTDGAELNFSVLGSLVTRHGGAEQAVRNMGDAKSLTNPIGMLRLLSTNPTYHVSKRLDAHGGGYPTQAMSLSGVCALEDAVDALASGRAPSRAVVVASGNMRSFDSLVAFGKLGLLGEGGGEAQIDPAVGSAALVLDCDEQGAGPAPVAEVLAVETFFAPDPIARPDTWLKLMQAAKARSGTPDVIVTYDNGGRMNAENEAMALEAVFPGIPTRNYKRLFGYTGKANSLLDLAAALSDPSIPAGAQVLICGTGLGFGVGYIALRKAGSATLQ